MTYQLRSQAVGLRSGESMPGAGRLISWRTWRYRRRRDGELSSWVLLHLTEQVRTHRIWESCVGRQASARRQVNAHSMQA